MSEALAIGGGIGTLGLAILLVIVLRWGMRSRDAEAGAVKSEAAERIEHGETKLKLERALYERDAAQKALDEMTKRADKLAKELSDALARQSLGAGLSPGDVDGRLRKLAAEAAATGSEVPAVAAPSVPDSKPSATGETIAAAVRNLGIIDDLR
jgi:hypothetical protein